MVNEYMTKRIVIAGLSVAVVGGALIWHLRPERDDTAKSSVDGEGSPTAYISTPRGAADHATTRSHPAGDTTLEADLSVPVQLLLEPEESESNYSALLAHVHALAPDLSEADTAALIELLTWSNDRFPEKMRSIESAVDCQI